MQIKLEKLKWADAEKLYEFELENRDYFETMVPSRGEDYYSMEAFKKRHESLIDEQIKGKSIFYLIKNENGLILGRMNLVDIDKSLNLGHVGYRVGEAYTGKGIANKALKLLLRTIIRKGIKEVLAQTTTNNIASQKVLKKNGFKYIKTNDNEFEMNRKRIKFIYYKWTI
jgi:ribosomal-protein-alanine N-acetyltransferase